MANIGYRADLPNYAGELYTADPTMTPFLSMIGGLTSGGKISNNLNFPLSSEYSITAAAQPAITEAVAAAGPPAAKNYTRSQTNNTVQIFQEGVEISYVTQATMGQMTSDGVLSFGSKNAVTNEKDWQIMVALQEIARDVEYSFLNGAYVAYSDEDSAFTTRGIITATTGGSNTVNAASATLTKDIFDEALIEAYGNGAKFKNPVIFCNAFQKVQFSNIYGYAPESRNVGGLNIKTIETDFGVMGIVLNPFVPAATVLVADLAVCSPVFSLVPGKPPLFYEDLGKSGAAELGQLFGLIGLDYGPEWMHLSITSLATS